MTPPRARIAAAALLALALAAAGCSTKADKAGDAAAPGVSDSTIKLGMLLDLSGAFAGSGKTSNAGSQLAVDEINAAGGVCGRKIELVVRDHGYDVQKAVTAYDEVTPDVLGHLNIYGSAVTTALREKVAADDVLVSLTAFAPNLLGDPHVIVVGSTYDVQAVNSVDWLMRQGMLKSGDTLGHIYLQGEIGENSFKGSTFATAQRGVKLVGQQRPESRRSCWTPPRSRPRRWPPSRRRSGWTCRSWATSRRSPPVCCPRRPRRSCSSGTTECQASGRSARTPRPRRSSRRPGRRSSVRRGRSPVARCRCPT
jgi:hypothetical protein